MQQLKNDTEKGASFGWALWIIPLIAISITAWLYYQDHSQRGPLVEIIFLDASGLEENKTPLRFRGINVGQVQRMELMKDSDQVLVYARLRKGAAHLAVEGSTFSIVQPEVGFEGISGLDTLLGGSYIRIERGSGEPQTKFEGLSGAPEPPQEDQTVTYYLRSPFADSINAGDPIFFRGMQVGSVTGLVLDRQGQWVDVEIRVRNQYVTLIRTNSVFWQKSAVSADVSLFGGAEIEIGSMQSLMKGGIVFATPEKPGEIANAQSRFPLQSKAPENWKRWAPRL